MKKEKLITKAFTFEGKRYYVRAKTEKEAIMKVANKMRDLEEGKVVVSGNTTVKEWALKCIDTYKTNQGEETRKTYLSRMNSCIFSQIGDRTLKSIKPFDAQNVLNTLQGQSKYQISAVYQMLRFIFSKAKVNKLIVEDPTLDLQKPKGTKENRRSLTPYEDYHFQQVAWSSDQFKVFLLMYYCGLRTSEAKEAMGKDIIFIKDENTVYPVLHIRGTKTENAERDVPIPLELYEKIKDTPKSSYIAPNHAGNKHTENSFKRAVKALRRALNISMGCKVYRNQLIPPYPLADDFVPYDLRHTYCTRLCKQKVDIRVAQKLMGHSDIRLTANIYTHADNSNIIEAAQLMQASKKANQTSDVAPAVAPTLRTIEK